MEKMKKWKKSIFMQLSTFLLARIVAFYCFFLNMEGVEYSGVIRASCVYTVSPNQVTNRLNKSSSERKMWLDEIIIVNTFYPSINFDTLS